MGTKPIRMKNYLLWPESVPRDLLDEPIQKTIYSQVFQKV